MERKVVFLGILMLCYTNIIILRKLLLFVEFFFYGLYIIK